MGAVGRGEEAARLYQQSLDIRRRLAEAEPDRADYQRDLVLGLQRFGQTLVDRDPGRAQALWAEAHAIASRLLEREPDRPDLATDLAVSLSLLSQSDEDPRPLLQRAVEILQRLTDRLPEHGQRLLAHLTSDQE